VKNREPFVLAESEWTHRPPENTGAPPTGDHATGGVRLVVSNSCTTGTPKGQAKVRLGPE